MEMLHTKEKPRTAALLVLFFSGALAITGCGHPDKQVEKHSDAAINND